MRTVIQRVKKASCTISGALHSKIDSGLLILLGIEEIDNHDDIDWLARKIIHLRIFDDDNGVMNRSILESDGEIMVVSQFTLHASTKKGNRPSYIRAAKPEIAVPLYETFCQVIGSLLEKEIKTGVFGADMQIELINDGPVTILIDSQNKE